MSDNQRPWWLY